MAKRSGSEKGRIGPLGRGNGMMMGMRTRLGAMQLGNKFDWIFFFFFQITSIKHYLFLCCAGFLLQN